MLCSEPDCNQPAVFTFVWPWGDPAACCSTHRVHAQQKADALGRGALNFTPLDPGAPQPITRDERVMLRATNLTLQEELSETKALLGKLHSTNGELSSEVRRLRARGEVQEALINEIKRDNDRLIQERDSAHADAGEAKTELGRLKLMLPTPPAL